MSPRQFTDNYKSSAWKELTTKRFYRGKRHNSSAFAHKGTGLGSSINRLWSNFIQPALESIGRQAVQQQLTKKNLRTKRKGQGIKKDIFSHGSKPKALKKKEK